MSVLNFDQDGKSKSRKPLKVLLGIGGLSAVVALASTLAANININSGPVEFGQGVASTTACDDSITVTPYSTFVNAADSGTHMLTSLTIGGIDSSPDKCAGKIFVIKAYGDSGQLDLFKWESNAYDSETNPDREWRETARYNAIEIWKDTNEFVWISDGSDEDDVTSEVSDITNTSFTLDLTSLAYEVRRSPLASAQSVKKITVETKQGDEVVPDIGEYVADFTSGSTNFNVTPLFSLDAMTSAPDGSVWADTNTSSSLTLSTDLVKSFSEHEQVNFGSASGTADLGNALDGMDRVTVEMFVKFNDGAGDWTSRPFAFSDSSVNSGRNGYGLYFHRGYLGINTYNDDILGFPSSSYNNSWHHIIWVASTGSRYTQKIYVDGVLKELIRFDNLEEGSRSAMNNGKIAVNLQDRQSSELKVGAVNIYAGEMPLASIAGQNMYFHNRLT